MAGGKVPTLERLDERSEAQGREIGELKKAIAELQSTVNRIDRMLSEARGGWKMLLMVGGAAGAAGAAITKVAAYLSALPR